MTKPAVSLDDRIRAALKAKGRMFTHDLARIVFPEDEYPRAWNYASQGGPAGWVMTMGKAIKRMGLKSTFDRDGRRLVSF